MTHPCLSCGACCSRFRVSFHWSETLPESFGVPVTMTSVISPHRLAMNGTNQENPVCVAFEGIVGRNSRCAIYENRPGCCRSFTASFEDGIVDIRCEGARHAKGLKPLTLLDWPAPA